MARIVKEYDDRHAEFLDVAQTLFFSKGYEQTSVQDIINTVGVAKGTFYHYFRSKVEVLDALVQRMFEQTLVSLEPLINDDTLNAVEKLEQFFGQVHQWKVANKGFLLETAHLLYRDENVLLREKMREESAKATVPIIADIIQQGVVEGVFAISYPDESAELIFTLLGSLSVALVPIVLAEQHEEDVVERMERFVLAWNQSIERVLGMSSTLTLIDVDTLGAWL